MPPPHPLLEGCVFTLVVNVKQWEFECVNFDLKTNPSIAYAFSGLNHKSADALNLLRDCRI